MSKSSTPMASFLEEHPRWIGILFTLTLLLVESGVAAGGSGGSATAGP